MSKVYVYLARQNPAKGVLTYDINSNLSKLFAIIPGKPCLTESRSRRCHRQRGASKHFSFIITRKAVNVLRADGRLSEMRADSPIDLTLWKPFLGRRGALGGYHTAAWK